MTNRLVNVRIPESLRDELAPHLARIPGMTMSKAVRQALRAYRERAEADEWRCLRMNADAIVKPPGEPFPPREDDIPTGRPLDAQWAEEESNQFAFRLDQEEHDRAWNALYWRSEYLSYEVEKELRAVIQRLDQIR